MKSKLSLLAILTLFVVNSGKSQCVPSCTNYIAAPINYTTFPTGTTIPTTSFSPNSDDGITPLIPIGFTFTFYCTPYTNLWICTNGFLQFNNGVPAVSTGYVDPAQIFPDPTAPNAIVSLNMGDLDLTLGGSISYTTVGVSPNQIFILTYSSVPIYGDLTSPNTGQILLYETSNLIEIHTGTVINNSSSSSVQGIQYGTQGVESANGAYGTVVPGRSKAVWTATNSAYRFSPYDIASPSGITGSTSICQGLSAMYQTTVASGVSSIDWYAPASWFGAGSTGVNSNNTFTVMSSGAISVTATYSCGTSAPTTLNVNAISAPTVNIPFVYPQPACTGNSINLSVSGAATYTLEPGGIVFSGATYVVYPNVTTTYTLTGEDSNGCLSYSYAVKTVSVNTTPTVSVNSGSICSGENFTMTPSGGVSYTYSNGSQVITNPPVGTYSYSVNSTVDGCTGSPAVSELTVYSMPNPQIIATKTVMCRQTESITLTAIGAQTYSWSNGGTASVNPVSSNAVGLQTYSVTGINAGGCSKTISKQINVLACTGIEEQQANANSVIIYPNPSTGEFTVKTDKDISILVYDIQGKVVLKQEMKSGENVINLHSQCSGQYLLKAVSEEQQQNIILIKE